MNDFSTWFGSGLQHILDYRALDHLLFVSLLATAYPPQAWKKLLVLVTAFTAGHCFSLIASLSLQPLLSSCVIEPLIAISIVLGGIHNIITRSDKERRKIFIYLIIFFFGLIHGLGFSATLLSLLGTTHEVILPLLYFNLGIEAGQLIVVGAVVIISLLLTAVAGFPFRYFKLISACIITLIALKLVAGRLPFCS